MHKEREMEERRREGFALSVQEVEAILESRMEKKELLELVHKFVNRDTQKSDGNDQHASLYKMRDSNKKTNNDKNNKKPDLTLEECMMQLRQLSDSQKQRDNKQKDNKPKESQKGDGNNKENVEAVKKAQAPPQLVDCRYFLRTGSCPKEKCIFRHCEAIKTSNRYCKSWLSSKSCQDYLCANHHPGLEQLKSTDCPFFLKNSCTNPNCRMRHAQGVSRNDVCPGWVTYTCFAENCPKFHPVDHSLSPSTTSESPVPPSPAISPPSTPFPLSPPRPSPKSTNTNNNLSSNNTTASSSNNMSTNVSNDVCPGWLTYSCLAETCPKLHPDFPPHPSHSQSASTSSLLPSMLPSTLPSNFLPPSSLSSYSSSSFSSLTSSTLPPSSLASFSTTSPIPIHSPYSSTTSPSLSPPGSSAILPSQASTSPVIPNSLGGIAYFWDIENCPVPKGMSALDAVISIRQKLQRSQREISFRCYCNVLSLSPAIQQELNHANVDMIHIPMQTKNAADLMMVRDMHSLEIHHKTPTTVVAISSDINFLPTLNDLKNRAKFDVIVLHLQVNPSIPKSCTNSYFWHEFLGIPSLPPPSPRKDAAPKENKYPSLVANNSSNNISLSTAKPEPKKQAYNSGFFMCKECGVDILGIRYKCNVCVDYDICTKCEEITTHDPSHAFLKIKNTTPPAECPICKRKFANPDRLKQHQSDAKHFELIPTGMNMASANEFPTKFYCVSCGQDFSTNEAMMQHRTAKGPHGRHALNSDENSDPEEGVNIVFNDFKCICGKTFATQPSLTQHQMAKHCATDIPERVLSSLGGMLLHKLIY